MLKLDTSTKFRRDFKRCLKRGYDMQLLQAVVDTLRIPAPLPEKTVITIYQETMQEKGSATLLQIGS